MSDNPDATEKVERNQTPPTKQPEQQRMARRGQQSSEGRHTPPRSELQKQDEEDAARVKQEKAIRQRIARNNAFRQRTWKV